MKYIKYIKYFSFNIPTTSFCQSCCCWTALVHCSSIFLLHSLSSSSFLKRQSLSSSFSTSSPKALHMIWGSTSFTLANSTRTPTCSPSYAQRSGSFGFLTVVAAGLALQRKAYQSDQCAEKFWHPKKEIKGTL